MTNENPVLQKNKMWQVGELEDENQILYVSAVPVTWMFMLKTKLLCYWPKHNSGLKIKNQQTPIPGSVEWTVYKCRVLMDGVRYKTYNEARKAEKIAADFSTISAYETQNQKRGFKRQNKNVESIIKPKISRADEMIKGTDVEQKEIDYVETRKAAFTGFLITDYVFDGDSNDNTEIKRAKSSQFFITDIEDEKEDDDTDGKKTVSSQFDEKRKGNDKDQKAKYSGFLITDCVSGSETDIESKQAKSSQFLITDLINTDEKYNEHNDAKVYENDDEKPEENGNICNDKVDSNVIIADVSGGSFDMNGYSFLTSTRIEEVHSPQSYVSTYISAIEETEMALSSFYTEMQLRLTKLKEFDSIRFASVPVSQKPAHVPEKQAPVTKSGTTDIPASEEVEPKDVTNSKIGRSKTSALDATFIKPDTVPVNNETFEIIEVSIDGVGVPNIGITDNEVLNVETSIDINVLDAIEVPICNKEGYIVMETALSDEAEKAEEDAELKKPIADYLIDYLKPTDGETVPKYFDRTIPMLFKTEFFIASITFKKERDVNRVLIKGTQILECWKESYGKQFGQGIVDDKVFCVNCRRFKNSKHAAKMSKKQRK